MIGWILESRARETIQREKLQFIKLKLDKLVVLLQFIEFQVIKKKKNNAR